MDKDLEKFSIKGTLTTDLLSDLRNGNGQKPKKKKKNKKNTYNKQMAKLRKMFYG